MMKPVLLRVGRVLGLAQAKVSKAGLLAKESNHGETTEVLWDSSCWVGVALSGVWEGREFFISVDNG